MCRAAGSAEPFDRASGCLALFLCFGRVELLIVDYPFELVDRLVVLAQRQISVSEIFVERVTVWLRHEYLGEKLRGAGEVAAFAQRIGKRGLVFHISRFGGDGGLELATGFFAVA